MHRAAQLLRQSDKKISEIALEMGYQNPSKFSEAFHAVIGCRPSAYRKVKKVEENHSDTFWMEVSFFGFLEHYAQDMAFQSGKRIFHMVICTS